MKRSFFAITAIGLIVTALSVGEAAKPEGLLLHFPFDEGSPTRTQRTLKNSLSGYASRWSSPSSISAGMTSSSQRASEWCNWVLSSIPSRRSLRRRTPPCTRRRSEERIVSSSRRLLREKTERRTLLAEGKDVTSSDVEPIESAEYPTGHDGQHWE